MASAGDRLQIVLSMKTDIAERKREVQKSLRDISKEMKSLQDDLDDPSKARRYEELSRQLDENYRRLGDLGKQAQQTNDKFKRMTAAKEVSDKAAKSVEDLAKKFGLSQKAAERFGSAAGRLAVAADAFKRRWMTAVDQIKARMSGLTSFIGRWAKRALIATGVAVAGAIGLTLASGFQRLDSIDQATAKLRGLGYSAQKVGTIMDSALASVKGTAFGLDEAAGLAANLTAAGVKPGQELERALRLTADAATIANTSMSEMAPVFSKVAATGRLTGESLAQLQDRGIPVLAFLAKSMGVTRDEAREMVSAGQVDFATFEKAMDEGLGGAAQESGKTFAGAMKNMRAALGRVGAAFLGPMFKKGKNVLGGITDAIDNFQPTAERIGKAMGRVFRRIVGWAKVAWHWFQEKIVPVLTDLREKVEAVLGFIARHSETFKTIAMGVGVFVAALLGLVAVTQVITVVTAAFNAELMMNPIVWIVLAIAAFIALLVVAYKKVDWFRAAVDAAWQWIQKAVKWFVDWFKTYAWPVIKTYLKIWWMYISKVVWPVIKFVFKAIVAVVKVVWAYISKVFWPTIRQVFRAFIAASRAIWGVAKDVWGKVVGHFRWAREKIKGFIDGIKGFFKGIWDGLVTGLPAAIDKIKEWLGNIPGLGGLIKKVWGSDAVDGTLFAGGPVAPGGTYLVGEIGPELFVPTFGPAKIIGADGPEIRDFHQSGTVIPNHLLHLAAPAVSVSVPPQQQQAQPLVGTMIVQDGRDVEGALVRAQTRAARITRERGA